MGQDDVTSGQLGFFFIHSSGAQTLLLVLTWFIDSQPWSWTTLWSAHLMISLLPTHLTQPFLS